LNLHSVVTHTETTQATRQASFPRRVEALAQVFEFTEAFCARHAAITHDSALALDLAVEELFTNLVKYQAGEAPVEIELRLELAAPGPTDATSGVVHLTLTGLESRAFDPRRAPDPATDGPARERRAGGLGLRLVRRLVAGLDYDHDPRTGTGCTRVRIALPPARHGPD
jgi:anti-sigma regulatory factor (Ser/Thr protein kinase)